MQGIPQSAAKDNVDLKDTWFTPYLKEYRGKTLSHKPSVAPENNNKMLMLPQYKTHVQKVRPERERMYLKLLNIHIKREFKADKV